MILQNEADLLIKMSKSFLRAGRISLLPGSDLTLDLIGNDNRERFLLDLWRGIFKLSKVKYQTRGRQIIVLARLDINGAPHTNPDGGKVTGTHLHIYELIFIFIEKDLMISGLILLTLNNFLTQQI